MFTPHATRQNDLSVMSSSSFSFGSPISVGSPPKDHFQECMIYVTRASTRYARLFSSADLSTRSFSTKHSDKECVCLSFGTRDHKESPQLGFNDNDNDNDEIMHMIASDTTNPLVTTDFNRRYATSHRSNLLNGRRHSTDLSRASLPHRARSD